MDLPLLSTALFFIERYVELFFQIELTELQKIIEAVSLEN